MKMVYNDGGRVAAGFKNINGGCVVRAIAIATRLPYKIVYDAIMRRCMVEKHRPKYKPSHPEKGVQKYTYEDYLIGTLGWKWVPTMGIGTGCKVHLRADELPKGRIIARVSKHIVAVIDGVNMITMTALGMSPDASTVTMSKLDIAAPQVRSG